MHLEKSFDLRDGEVDAIRQWCDHQSAVQPHVFIAI